MNDRDIRADGYDLAYGIVTNEAWPPGVSEAQRASQVRVAARAEVSRDRESIVHGLNARQREVWSAGFNQGLREGIRSWSWHDAAVESRGKRGAWAVAKSRAGEWWGKAKSAVSRRKNPRRKPARRSNPHFATAAEEMREIVSLDNRHMASDDEFIYAVGWDYYDSRQYAHFNRKRAAEDYAHMIHARGAPHVRVFTAKTPIRSRGASAWKIAPPTRSRR